MPAIRSGATHDRVAVAAGLAIEPEAGAGVNAAFRRTLYDYDVVREVSALAPSSM